MQTIISHSPLHFFRSDALHTIVQPVEIVGSYGGVIILHDNGSIRILDVSKRQEIESSVA